MRFHIKLLLFICGSFLIGDCKCGGDTGITVETMPSADSIVSGISDIPQEATKKVPRSAETIKQIEDDRDRLRGIHDSLMEVSKYRHRDCEFIYQEFLLAYREAAEGKKERLKNIKWEDPVVSYCMDKYKSRFDSLEILFPEK